MSVALLERRRHDGLVIVLSRLDVLRDVDDAEEATDPIPTSFAFERTRDLIIRANEQMQNEFPRGTASTEYDGGIRIEWRKGRREVKLITAAQTESLEYLYHEENNDHGLEKNIDPELLADWLDWLTQP